jgi:hypothetical protein
MNVIKIGFVVVENCEDFEQTLAINVGTGLPEAGVLNWREKDEPAFVFKSKPEAKAAIDRTEHYRLAFGSSHPVKKDCKIVALETEAAE